MTDIERKEVCKCENCGNEAEMVFTCSIPDFDKEAQKQSPSESEKQPATKKRVKGTGTCSNCGNEADMWIDL